MRRRSALKSIGGVAIGSTLAGCLGGGTGEYVLQPVATEVEVVYGTVTG